MPITLPFGGDQAHVAETFPQYLAVSTGTTTANRLCLAEVPRRNTSLIVTKFRIYVATQGGNVDVGAWEFNGTTWTLLVSTGSTVVGTGSAIQEIAVLAPFDAKRPAGRRLFFGLCPDNATASFQRTANTMPAALAADEYQGVFKASSFPLVTNAASFTTGSVSGNNVQYWIRGIA